MGARRVRPAVPATPSPGGLRQSRLRRYGAACEADPDIAWMLAPGSVPELLRRAAAGSVPVRCHIGGRCIDPAHEPCEPHLPAGTIHEIWVVRQPAAAGHATSVEVYDADGRRVLRFTGLCASGEADPDEWRLLAESLPRATGPRRRPRDG